VSVRERAATVAFVTAVFVGGVTTSHRVDGGDTAAGAGEPSVGTHTFTNVVTYTVPTVTETVTVTAAGTTAPPPPPPPPPPAASGPCVSAPWPAGSQLPARIAESTGPVLNVTTSSGFRSALLAVNPGETIQLAAGRYGAGELSYVLTRSGTAAAPITIEGAGTSTVIETRLRVEGDFVRVRNLLSDGTLSAVANGFYLTGGANDVELCGIEVKNQRQTADGPNPQGVLTSSTTARVHFINFVADNNGRPGNVLDHGMYLSGTAFLLVNVLLYDNSAFGAQFYSNLSNSIATHVTTVSNNLKSGVINAGSSTGNRVFNSVAVGNAAYGFENTGGTLTGDHLIAWQNGAGAYRSVSPCVSCTTVDPLLDPSYRPAAGSPALGFSNPAYSPQFDLYGSPRSAPDAGAVEG
jgi:hypothetical protein